jgi:hypothetical protein
MSATVTLDREAVIDLLVEIHAVQDVLEAHAGNAPEDLMRDLLLKAQGVEDVILGPIKEGPDGRIIGAHLELWQAGERRAEELVGAC